MWEAYPALKRGRFSKGDTRPETGRFFYTPNNDQEKGGNNE